MDALLEREEPRFPRDGFSRSNKIAVAVAAVYDCRMQAFSIIDKIIDSKIMGTENGSHRQPLQNQHALKFGLQLAKVDNRL